jgi:aspartate/methionine/tyrosine aminotransferase
MARLNTSDDRHARAVAAAERYSRLTRIDPAPPEPASCGRLEQADVVVFAGEDFGLSPYIRVSFANSPLVIEEAGQRLKRACDRLQ